MMPITQGSGRPEFLDTYTLRMFSDTCQQVFMGSFSTIHLTARWLSNVTPRLMVSRQSLLSPFATRTSICRAKVYAMQSRLQFVRQRDSYKEKCPEKCILSDLRWLELCIKSVSWATPSAQEAPSSFLGKLQLLVQSVFESSSNLSQ